MQMETAIPNIFEILANGFKDMKKEILNKILMNLIYSMKKEHESLKKLYEEIQINNDILLDENLEDFYDSLELAKMNAQRLYKLSDIHKNKSEIFMEFYNTSSELYEDLVKIPYEISSIESNLIHQGKLDYAS
ncbi:hypothetical protein LCX93_06505 [Sulfurimonas sp. SWIR-19]|uniref:hypothetical protein n=1 Tax=Sulfurimonas sp. SWIR-19 TaxID=2878390 RepID=UPI001CF4E0FD|nr:hypothetical protein [Sulfurimonas sp. SWIR-19]UCM99191.1 hypothetical protein LCX93_06505 [Sulfurimonas sp. SWIR-19]